MLKQEIIEKITKYFKLTHFEAEKIYDDIFQNIIEGVKKDSVTDVSNLGEFIIKNNENSSEYKKTVEFLPAAVFEEEISEAGEPKEQEVLKAPEPVQQIEPQEIKQEEVPKQVAEEEIKITAEEQKEEIPEAETFSGESLSVEDEMRRKREQIINRLSPQHEEEYHKLLHVTGKPLNVPQPIVIKDRVYDTPKEELSKPVENLEENKEIKEETEKTEEQIKTEDEKQTVDQLSAKSFSDYFTEVKKEQKSETPEPPYVPPVSPVIPPAAVELHNEIVNEEPPRPPVSYQPEVKKPFTEHGTGNGYSDDSENRANDNSYYIWYKDSEPNAVDTQTMSYEYELLYQATKEAEYKSKLRIYVTTFILFFSIVLLLLIFSPVIYKYFFTPQETSNEEVVPTESGTGENPTAPNNKADVNRLEQNNAQTNPPATSNEQSTQKPPEQQSQTNTNVNIPGVVKVEGGWKDEKLGVTYVQLENSKFTIQESAWNSEEKANSRVNTINSYNIAGLKGSVVKADLGAKGTWYRVRAGEFSSIEEAKSKAEELRKK